jgi:hypothetical protein
MTVTRGGLVKMRAPHGFPTPTAGISLITALT